MRDTAIDTNVTCRILTLYGESEKHYPEGKCKDQKSSGFQMTRVFREIQDENTLSSVVKNAKE